MTRDFPIMIRRAEATESDRKLIYSNWLESYLRSPVNRDIRRPIYFQHQHDIIESLLNHPANTTLLACDKDDPDQIFGWACGGRSAEVAIVHYVYTKQPFRRFGIANRLLTELFDGCQPDLAFVTHLTTMGRALTVARDKDKWFYHPYLIHTVYGGSSASDYQDNI